jgi:hypothetical protein
MHDLPRAINGQAYPGDRLGGSSVGPVAIVLVLRVACAVSSIGSSALRMTGIAIGFKNFVPPRRDEKLPPHFSEARTTIFAIKKVQNDGHDRTPVVEYDDERRHFSTSLGAKGDLVHVPPDERTRAAGIFVMRLSCSEKTD